MTRPSAERSTRAQSATESEAEDPPLDSFAFSPEQLARLEELAAPESWGDDGLVLRRLLALHAPLAIGQGLYVWTGKQLVMRAGPLATAEGEALYIGLARAEEHRWKLDWVGTRPQTVEPLSPADLGAWPDLAPHREVVIAVDTIRSTALDGLPWPTQHAAVSGAVAWSLRRGLAARQIRGERRSYFVPVHLTSHDAPDHVAPLQIQPDRLVVRALIDPRSAYPSARVAAEHVEQVPAWLREAWGAPATT